MKTDFEARPVYLQREDCIQAHFLVCFIALLVYKLLDTALAHKYTCEQLLDTLRKMEVTYHEGFGYTPHYNRSEITDALHDYAGFNTDREIIRKAKMRTIIKESKEY